MSEKVSSIILHPSVPFRPFLLFNHQERSSYLQHILEEYLGLIDLLKKLPVHGCIGVIFNPLMLNWFQSSTFKEAVEHYFSSADGEKHPLLLEHWAEWHGELIEAFHYYMKCGRLAAISSVISDFPLTILHTPEAMDDQLNRTIQIWQACFQCAPKGLWLPQCAYTSGIDVFLKKYGITYIFLEDQALPPMEGKKKYTYKTAYGVKIQPICAVDDEHPWEIGDIPVYVPLPRASLSFFQQLVKNTKHVCTESRRDEEKLIHVPFCYLHFRKRPLLDDHALECSMLASEMERKIARVKERLPDEESFLLQALIQEWMYYLYAIAHRASEEERMNYYHAFHYIYEGIRQDLCDYDFIQQRYERLLLEMSAPTQEKKAESHHLTDEKRGVLLFTWEYPPRIVGGLSRHVHDLAISLVKEGLEIYVITAAAPGAPSYECDEGVHVFRTGPLHCCEPDFLKWLKDLNACMLKKAVELIGERRIQLLHAHDWLVSYVALSCKDYFHLPLITTIHATEFGRTQGDFTDLQLEISYIEKSLINQSDYLIVCSQPMKEEVQTYYLEKQKPIFIIPNGVFIDEQSGAAVQKRQTPYVFSIGRMVKEKGFHVLIEAAEKIVAKQNIQFVIAGKGPLLNYFRKEVEKRNLAPFVHFIGFVTEEERCRLFTECEIAVFPSLYEPFGIVALEAMAAQKPVIASHIGGLTSFVLHEETGLLCIPGDERSLQLQLERLLQDRKLYDRISRSGYELAKNIYNWQKISVQTKQVYDQAIVNLKMEGVRS
ncbi:glycosyltransferase [Bacillus sp. REN10]|uniref:glycosyltransferase n=1 Tax=Bacillus sp. REN10 TaxID=2782541 RepID=UPI00193C001B|nr:glycosyltransferase [Bacillus sp. REN10]